MKLQCYHYGPITPIEWPCAWSGYTLPSGNMIAVHSGDAVCPDPASHVGHILSGKTVPAKAAADLAQFGVTTSDTILQAILKVGATFREFLP